VILFSARHGAWTTHMANGEVIPTGETTKTVSSGKVGKVGTSSHRVRGVRAGYLLSFQNFRYSWRVKRRQQLLVRRSKGEISCRYERPKCFSTHKSGLGLAKG
jgi:hypothetical protein